MDAIYNVTMLAVDVAVLSALAKSPSRARPWFAVGLIVGAAGLLGCFAGGMFSAMRLLAYGLFLHLPLALLVGGWWCQAGWQRCLFFATALLVVIIALDAFWWEPSWLQQTRYVIESPKVQQEVRIVLLADLQTDHISDYEQTVVQQAVSLNPDMIVWAGDYLQLDDGTDWDSQRDALRQIFDDHGLEKVPYVYAVTGNVDSPRWPEIFAGYPNVRVSTSTEAFTDGPVAVTCLGLRDSFNTSLSVDGKSAFHLVVGHGPDFALGKVDADLLLAGHVHGGQVRLPWFGPLVTLSQLPRRWTVGRTDLSDGRTLIVSRGIGMERGPAPRLRFLCRPEIVVVDVVPVPANNQR